ncbi:MAG: hypothetical protein IT384_08780 [Deltaproteobacteria bacterium]|nr:hypothetical protein [Deltaproteobacteria bacterium]
METNIDLSHYPILGGLFEPPGPGFGERVARAREALAGRYPEAAALIERFQEHLPLADLHALEELHVRTYHIQAITTLDVGYTLFGEDYKRGALLAGLSREHREVDNDCGSELADHLPNVLRLMSKMRDPSILEELVRVIVGPAVREMVREFEPERIAKKEELYKKHHKTLIEHAGSETRVAHRYLVEALYDVLKRDFGLRTSLPIEQEGSFERSLGTEMCVEGCAPSAQ